MTKHAIRSVLQQVGDLGEHVTCHIF